MTQSSRTIAAAVVVAACLLAASAARGQQPQGPQPAPRLAQPAPQAAPPANDAPVAPFQLDGPQQQYLNDILRYWEFRSAKIERYRCKFTRFVYDPVFGPKDRFTAKSQSAGVLKYAAPDKGLFKIEKIAHYTPPRQEGGSPLYLERPGETGEYWICDGQSVYEFNYEKQQLIQRELPPDMRGKAIADGPLPFLFGAKADKIQQRYWMRVITPPDVKGEYWLEAYPKMRGDAAQFKKIEVILDEKEYLPKAIQVFDPNYDERRNPSRTVFVFDEREVNWNDGLAEITRWIKGEFYEPTPPKGWKKVVEPYKEVVPAPQTAQQPLPVGQRRQ
jgi:TIGR03009 family protein